MAGSVKLPVNVTVSPPWMFVVTTVPHADAGERTTSEPDASVAVLLTVTFAACCPSGQVPSSTWASMV